MQTRSELLCEGGVDQSVALDCRLGCMFSEVVEKRGENLSEQPTRREISKGYQSFCTVTAHGARELWKGDVRYRQLTRDDFDSETGE